MNKAAIYHRPESEFAYLYAKNLMHVRLQTQKSDVEKVELFYGDPYSWEGLDNPKTQYWASQKVEMKSIFLLISAIILRPKLLLQRNE